jgi:DNA uptake protein ComE-like DNA-binding protein
MGWSAWVSKVRLLSKRHLADPYHRFETVEQVRAAAAQGVCIDVNQAGVDDWLRLPGVSIHQARSLVALAQSGVQFHCLEDVAAAMGMPLQRLRPLEPILTFRYYDAESIDAIQPVNPNTASVEGLSRIPQVDLYLARAIVRDRQLHGAYSNLASLQQRLSLSAELTATLMHYLRF